MVELGKTILILGIILIVIGGIVILSSKVPFLGKLPGDIYIKKGNFAFYSPIATSILLSIILTIIINLFLRK